MKHSEDSAIDGLRLDHLARERLVAFTEALIRWNPTIKLVSSQDIDQLWMRHVEDALQLVHIMPPDLARAIDLGSGGGFPGLVLALATGVHFDLIESDGRKAAFLQEAITITKATATVHPRRIEDVKLEPCRLVTARALAPLSKLLELSAPFLAKGGICLFPKGHRVESEIAEASREWAMELQQLPSRTSPIGRILRISNPQRRELWSA